MNEEWRDIEGYEGLYQVSTCGRVRRINKDKRCPQYKYLNPYVDFGYFKVILSANGVSKNHLLHRIIAKAFIENPLNKPCVNHIDGNKKNNSLNNLEWTTVQENTKHAFSHGLCDEMIKNSSKRIDQCDMNGKLIKTWNSFHEIERTLHFHATQICKQIRHRKGYAYGFIWRYSDE